MKTGIRSQRGIGVVQLLFLVAIVAATLTIVLKLGPYYKQYFEVRSVMQEVRDDPELVGESRLDIMKSLSNRLYINYITGIKAKDFKLKKAKNGYELSVKYKVQEHLFANVDVILTFSHAVQLDRT